MKIKGNKLPYVTYNKYIFGFIDIKIIMISQSMILMFFERLMTQYFHKVVVHSLQLFFLVLQKE